MSGIFDQVINYSPPSLLTGTVTYEGTWSAATNTPTLPNPPSSVTNGHYYVVSAGGTQFSLVFNIGDWIISNGSAWEKVDNTDAVDSVFGRTGAVVGVSTDYSAVGITNTALGASNPSTVAATTITASSTIAATGAVTGSNLSGTNTGDQTITLTGGVTGSGTGSFAATVVTNANLTGVITSVGNATSIASQTGTGTKFVVDTSPTLVTPNIGIATGTSLAAALNGSLGATTPSSVAATTGTFSSTLGVTGVATLGNGAILGTPASGNLASCTGYVGTSALVTVGALNSGSITSGFGAIDVGADAISGGAISGTTGTFSGVMNFGMTGGTYAINARGGSGLATLMLQDSSNGNKEWRLASQDSGAFKIIESGVAEQMVISAGGSTSFVGGLNSTAIGATTPSTGAFTTLSATGTISHALSANSGVTGFSSQNSNAGSSAYLLGSLNNGTNTFNSYLLGLNWSGTFLTGGPTSQSAGFYTSANIPVSIGINNTEVARISSTGLAVTGTLSATDTISTTKAVASAGNIVSIKNSTDTGGDNTRYAGVNFLVGSDDGTSSIRSYRTNSATNYETALAFLTNPSGATQTPTEKMRIDSSGNVGIGTTTPTTKLDVVGALLVTQSASNTAPATFTSSHATTPVGATFNFSAAAPNNGTQTFWVASDTSAYRGGFLSNGGLQNYQSNNSNLSDRREKKNIQLAPNYLDKICQIPVKTFLFNDQTDTELNLGSIAQDVQAVCPELITESNWGTEEEPKMRLSIYQTDLQYALMKCIQELKAINDTQAARLAALEAK